jgi:hypothetical protein
LLERFKWMSLPRSSILLYSVIVTLDGEDKFWWFPLEKDCLFLAPSTIPLLVMMVEEYMADYDSFERGLFCLVGGLKKDPCYGQP